MIAPLPTCNGMGPCIGDYPHWNGLSVPVIVGFNIFTIRDPRMALRSAVRIGLEGAGGMQPSTDAFGWHMGLSLGVALL